MKPITPEHKNSILQALELTIGYHEKSGLNVVEADINLKLQQGELIGLVGANGIGKSTLLKTFCGILPPLHGEIHLNNRNIQQYEPLELSKLLSVVLTEAPASKHISVQELVALGRHPYTNWVGSLTEEDIVKVKSAIEITHIQDIVHRKCYELSDGQLQKVMIARAIAQDTPLIILDEPTTHLDVHYRAYILKLLRRLSFELKKTILFSTHEIDFSIQVCDKMIVMNKDRTEYGRPKELIACRAFHELFPDDLIIFDESSERYLLRS
ncbi:ABC transporter ATP-binding protein [Aquimarina sp. ERC-38]|uniref:ABC transporter ATP-binding protein n=1 Tax=Aquimarina sp. ERC-38 TaxID=2949996 RepID=UPI0022467E76|nr:ABC transporter ATP-binding protein [Aquimarina sp. ERC-38]UZO80780.1 ABC transporter ATP-binding protein [Aquimarina sp. ERC-38]